MTPLKVRQNYVKCSFVEGPFIIPIHWLALSNYMYTLKRRSQEILFAGNVTWISLGNVALNISVWRSPALGIVSWSTMRRICGSNPMSNMRSASSRTRNLIKQEFYHYQPQTQNKILTMDLMHFWVGFENFTLHLIYPQDDDFLSLFHVLTSCLRSAHGTELVIAKWEEMFHYDFTN